MKETAPTRQVVVAALVLLVVGAAGALQAARAGGSFMRDLEHEQPALSRIAPVVDVTPPPRMSRRVFLVIVDGLRLDRSYQLPFLDELRRRGVDTEAVSHYPSWSRPNYVSILTGVPPIASGVRTNHHSQPVQLDSLMDRARAAGLRVATATDYDVLPRMFLRRRGLSIEVVREPIDIDIDEDEDVDEDTVEDRSAAAAVRTPNADLASPFDDARYAPWPGGFSEAGAALVAGNAELVVLLVGAVDAAGHGHGAKSEKYRDAALTADDALARVLGKIDLSQDTIVVTSDHGHTNRGGHGGIEPEVLTVPLVLAGPAVRAEAISLDAKLVDIAPTVAALLGIPAPGHGLGRTLTELLVLTPEAERAAKLADHRRLSITRPTVARAEAQADRDVLEHRAWRLAIVLVGATLAILLAIVLVRRNVMKLDIRVLAVAIPAFFVVYFALIALLGQRFSPSLLPARGHLGSVLLRYGLGGMVVQLVASMWVLRRYQRLSQRLAAANGIALVGLMLTMVPAGVLWAFFPPPFVTLPGPLWLVMIPALEVAVGCAALNVALTLAVEVIIFAARAWGRDRNDPKTTLV